MASTRTVKNQLAEREAQHADGVALEKRNGHPLTQVKDLLDRMTPEIARALPAHMTAERMARIVFTQIRYEPKLAKCSPESLAGAVLTMAQTGMEPGPTGEAYLVPYWNKDTRTFEAQFQLGYKGMAKLFWQHPLAQYLDAQTVYEADDFDYAYGLDAFLRHKPAKGDRGEPVYWYAVARLTNGGYRFAVLDRAEIERHRKMSSSPNSPGWTRFYNEMASKTCIRVMFNLLPKSVEIARAMAADERTRTDLSPDALDAEPPFIEGEVVRNGNGGGHAPAGVDETTGEVTDPAVLAEAEDDGEPDWEAIDAAREAEEEAPA